MLAGNSELLREKKQRDYDAQHSQQERNVKGQFATPYALAESISRDAISRVDRPQSMLEPACGTGSFISASTAICPDLRVYAVEKDPNVYAIADSLWSSDRITVKNADFFDVVSSLRGFDLLITNPPYSRHHHLSSDEKERYSSYVELATGYHLSQLAGLHAYFIIAGTNALNDGGVASWLIPSELFSVNYGRAIRDYITSAVTVERIHFFENDDLQFSDALVSSCVLILRKAPASPDKTVEITLGDFDNPARSDKIALGKLRKLDKWQHYFTMHDFDRSRTIGDYFTVKRGLSTGAESFYSKSRTDWNNLGIDDCWLIPVLPAPRYMHDLLIDSDADGWPLKYDRALLSIPDSIDELNLPEPVISYLDTCPPKIRNSYTSRHRKPWYSIEHRDPPPIVCTYMSRSDSQPFRFIRNKSKAVVTTAYLCMYPKGNVSESEIDKLCSALNSIEPDLLINSGREYGGGLRKLEPKELLTVPIDF